MRRLVDSILGERALAAIAPFAVWMALMPLLPATAAGYAIRTFATLAALCVAVPFLRRRGGDGATRLEAAPSTCGRPSCLAVGLSVGVVVGVAVAVAWIAPEYSAAYRKWFVVGATPNPAEPYASEYAPGKCGWTKAWCSNTGKPC